MAKQTKRQRIEAALAARGYKPVPNYPTKKYNVWYLGTGEGYVFVGKSGGLRTGCNVSNSLGVDPQRWLGVS